MVVLLQVLVYSTVLVVLLLELNWWIQLNCHLQAAFGFIGVINKQKLLDRHLLYYSCFFFATIILSVVALVNSILSCKNITVAPLS